MSSSDLLSESERSVESGMVGNCRIGCGVSNPSFCRRVLARCVLPVLVVACAGFGLVSLGYTKCATGETRCEKSCCVDSTHRCVNGACVRKVQPVARAVVEFAQISAGGGHTCGVTKTGAVKCWGSNSSGQIGDNTFIDKLVPTQVWGLARGVTMVSAGALRSYAVKSSSEVVCWGSDYDGYLGIGRRGGIPVSVPMALIASGTAMRATAVSSGLNGTTCAFAVGSVASCWGENFFGSVGDGTRRTRRDRPTEVQNLADGINAISSGGHHVCALKSTGAVLCWGRNDYGQLGDGTGVDRLVPARVTGLESRLDGISMGGSHSCVLKSTGGLVCFGKNSNGQIGDGTGDHRSVPRQVKGLEASVSAISAGWEHTCAIKSNGAVVCWGSNKDGQLGDGTQQDRFVPTQVVGLESGVSAITAGSGHSCALKSTGAVVCWGKNDDGRLGDGTTIDRLTPTPVAGTF